jgi:hypothetical protein
MWLNRVLKTNLALNSRHPAMFYLNLLRSLLV